MLSAATLMTPDSLQTRSVSAFLWGGAGSIIKLVIQIGTQVALARMLGPDQYGLFAIGGIVISFSNFFSDAGIAYGLIQRRQITEAHIRYVSTWQLVLGVVVSLTVAALAGHLAVWFKEPRAESILLALAPICFIQAATAVPLNLLKRDLDFKTLQLAQTAGYLLGYVAIGVPLAIAGAQVWALIAAWSVQVAVTYALLYWHVRHAVKPLFQHVDARDMTGFGFKVLATNLTNWVISNIDRVVIARHLPTAAVGLYATPYNLMYTPSTTLMGVIQPVMYSACARVQGDRARIGKAYLTLVTAVSLSMLPVYIAVAVVAQTFILALYGPAWAAAADVLRPIALAMPLYLLWNITTPPLWTNGQPSLEFKLQIPLAILWLVAALVAIQYSVVAVAWTVFTLFLLRLAVFVIAASHITGVTAGEYFRAVKGGLLLGGFMGLVAWCVDTIARLLDIQSAISRLLLIVAACLLTGLLALWLLPRIVSPGVAELIEQAANRIPGSGAKIVKRFFDKGRRQ